MSRVSILTFYDFPIEFWNFSDSVAFFFHFIMHIIPDCDTAGATSGTGTAHPFGAPELNPGLLCGWCCSIFSFLCIIL